MSDAQGKLLAKRYDSLHSLGAIFPNSAVIGRLCYVQTQLQRIYDKVSAGEIDEMGVIIRAFNLGKVLIEWRIDIPFSEAYAEFLAKDFNYNNTELVEHAHYTDLDLEVLDEFAGAVFDDEESLD